MKFFRFQFSVLFGQTVLESTLCSCHLTASHFSIYIDSNLSNTPSEGKFLTRMVFGCDSNILANVQTTLHSQCETPHCMKELPLQDTSPSSLRVPRRAGRNGHPSISVHVYLRYPTKSRSQLTSFRERILYS